MERSRLFGVARDALRQRAARTFLNVVHHLVAAGVLFTDGDDAQRDTGYSDGR